MKKHLFLALTALVACTNGNKTVKHLENLGDTPYQEDTVLVTYGTNPERALVLLDSAVLLGNIDEYREKIVRATIYSKSLNEQNQDSAIAICETLLKHDSVLQSPANHQAVLNILIATCRASADFNEYMRWATEKAEVCREQGEEVELLRTEAEIGMVMTHLGQIDEGLAKLDNSISQLDKPGSIDRMDAFVVAAKRKISVLNDLGRYADIIPLAQRTLDRLDHYEHHPKEYAEDSYRLSWSDHPSDRDRYLDFSRAQAWGFMAIAYATPLSSPERDTILMSSANGTTEAPSGAVGGVSRAQALHYYTLFNNSNYGKTFSARRMILPAQIALGLYDEVLGTCQQIVQRAGDDTINSNYATALRDLAVVERAKGHTAAAYDLMNRHARLSQLLSDSLHKSEAHDYAARYHAQEQQLKIQEQEAEAKRSHIINIALGAGLLFVLLFAYYIVSKNRIINMKNHGLVRLIDETIKYKNRKQTDVGSEALFARLSRDIREHQLYLDPLFDRQAICDRFHLSASQVGNAFAQGSDYGSVADFIRDCRLEHACSLLKSTDMKVADIALASGFSRPTTFNHDFKARYNLSPTEYRRQ